eukprot:6458673-Amphidinium_carterae.1
MSVLETTEIHDDVQSNGTCCLAATSFRLATTIQREESMTKPTKSCEGRFSHPFKPREFRYYRLVAMSCRKP